MNDDNNNNTAQIHRIRVMSIPRLSLMLPKDSPLSRHSSDSYCALFSSHTCPCFAMRWSGLDRCSGIGQKRRNGRNTCRRSSKTS